MEIKQISEMSIAHFGHCQDHFFPTSTPEIAQRLIGQARAGGRVFLIYNDSGMSSTRFGLYNELAMNIDDHRGEICKLLATEATGRYPWQGMTIEAIKMLWGAFGDWRRGRGVKALRHRVPYCCLSLADGSCIILNRDYKPLGMPKGEWVDYEIFPDHHLPTTHPISLTGGGWLFGDLSAPWLSKRHLFNFMYKLHLLTVPERDIDMAAIGLMGS